MRKLQRGVYEAPFLSSGGDNIMVAVTSKGRFAGMLAYSDEAQKVTVIGALWFMLDEADPVPMLRLA